MVELVLRKIEIISSLQIVKNHVLVGNLAK
jgi:hypothetical protein